LVTRFSKSPTQKSDFLSQKKTGSNQIFCQTFCPEVAPNHLKSLRNCAIMPPREDAAKKSAGKSRKVTAKASSSNDKVSTHGRVKSKPSSSKSVGKSDKMMNTDDENSKDGESDAESVVGKEKKNIRWTKETWPSSSSHK
jgi:hypothetical protein